MILAEVHVHSKGGSQFFIWRPTWKLECSCWEGRENGEPGGNPSGRGMTRTFNKLNPHVIPGLGNESIHSSTGGGGDCFQHQPFPALPWYFFNILGLYQDDLYITKWNNTTIIILVWANFSKANIEFSTTPGYSAIVYERQRKNSLTLDLH